MNDPYAQHAHRLGARNGSPFASDRTFKRPPPAWLIIAAACRDLLALAALVAIFGAILVALSA